MQWRNNRLCPRQPLPQQQVWSESVRSRCQRALPHFMFSAWSSAAFRSGERRSDLPTGGAHAPRPGGARGRRRLARRRTDGHHRAPGPVRGLLRCLCSLFSFVCCLLRSFAPHSQLSPSLSREHAFRLHLPMFPLQAATAAAAQAAAVAAAAASAAAAAASQEKPRRGRK